MEKRLVVLGVLAVVALTVGSADGNAQQTAYPSGPVTLKVGWAPGSASDIGARALAESTQKFLGQRITVENVVGGGSALAATQIAKAKPDGQTLLFTAFGILTQPHLEAVPYKPLEDFVPVLQVGGYPELLVVGAASPYKTLKDFVNFAKANPGKVRIATSGFGSGPHIAEELLARAAGVQFTTIPFNSGAEGVATVMGGHLEAAFSTSGATYSLIKSGKLRSLGLTLPERYPGMPEIPTLKEQGFDVSMLGWWAIVAPKGTPDSIVQAIDAAFKKGMATAPYTTVMEMAQQPIIYLGPKDIANLWKQQYATFGDMLKSAKK